MPNNVDPITMSVVSHRLTAIVEEMGEAMLRTSYSQILNSSRDFSAAICDDRCRLVAQAEHIPVHVSAMPWAAKAVSRTRALRAAGTSANGMFSAMVAGPESSRMLSEMRCPDGCVQMGVCWWRWMV